MNLAILFPVAPAARARANVVKGALNRRYAHAPVYSPHECFFKETREPRLRYLASLHVLQLRSHPSDFEDHARDGRWRYQAPLGND